MSAASSAEPRIEPAALRRPQAARFVGMGTSTWDRHDAAGLIPEALRIGGVKVWSVAELKAWLAAGCPDRAAWRDLWVELQRRQHVAKK